MDNESKIEYWLDLAQEDIVTAKVMLESQRYLHFGFICHLACERLLKAFFWKNRESEPPYTHNLLKLSAQSGLDEIINDKFKKLHFKLMPLNIEARYPSDKDKIYEKLTKDFV